MTYKLRDWLFSRQRYWGEPFPVIHVDGQPQPLDPNDLPVSATGSGKLQADRNWRPTAGGGKQWVETTDAKTGKPAKRETNTMPQWAGSCWYFLRFIDPHNAQRPWDPEKERYWMPVDLYVGGVEHAVLHLLYSRFWHQVLYDCGLVSTSEPFQRLVNQGMILGFSYRYYEDPTGKRYAYHAVQKMMQDGGEEPDYVLAGNQCCDIDGSLCAGR